MGRIKTIIMDIAPNGNNVNMATELGFDMPALDQLATICNTELGTHITGADLAGFQTVAETVNWIESQLP